MFQLLFERSADAVFLLDPRQSVFLDCNQAAVELMRSPNKDRLLMMHPADLSPEHQPDGQNSRVKTAAVIEQVLARGTHRFEWVARRLDGTDVPVEVLLTAIQAGGHPLIATVCRDITERRRIERALRESEARFRGLFEQSADAMSILDPVSGRFIDSNEATARLTGAPTREALGNAKPEEISPERQPDGQLSSDKAAAMVRQAMEQGSHRFEWLTRRFDGTDLHIDVVLTTIPFGERPMLLVVSRDISARKRTEAEVGELAVTLERRIVERTAELAASEARLRTLVEHAPEAMVVFDGDTGRFLNCNENATRLYGLSRDELLAMHPADVSPLFQPDGRLSLDAAREHIQQALNGAAPVFEWMHKHSSGELIPCEVRLVRLPAEGRTLVRGSVIDNTERKRREKIQQATYQISEAVHAAEDLNSLYAHIHETIKGLMPAENFYIALYEPATELISFPYHVDERSEKPKPFKLGNGLTSCVLRSTKPLLVTATMAERKQRVGDAVTFDGLDGQTYVEAGTPAAIWLGVPLILQGKPIGAMAVQDYTNERAYGEEEKQILTFVATQTALAIDRKRSEQALWLRSEQIHRHRNVLLELALLDKSNLERALAAICASAATVSGLERVGYWSLEDGGAGLACEVLYRLDRRGLDPTARKLRLGAARFPKYFAALATKEPIVAHRAETHPDTSDFTESYLRPLGITSMLDVPVWLHGKLVGVFCQEHVGEPHTWTPEEVDFASSLATMVSLSLEAVQRARSEQALRESEHKFRALFEASSQGVILHDDKQYLEVNPAALRILKYTHVQDFIGKHPVDTSPPIQLNGEETAPAAARHIAACLEKGTERFEWTAQAATGEPVLLDVILTRVEMGGKWLIQAVIDDISERKKAEAELLRALAHEKELSQLKSNFVSMVSHEFRTPLGIIMSSAEILDDYLEQLEPDEREHHLHSIARSTRRMSDLMEEVLVLGRLDAGRMEFTPAPLDLRTLCSRLVQEVTSATEGRCPIEFGCDLPDGEAQADEKLLRHILTNLLSNAVKYSETGVPVEFTLRRDGAEAVCVIRDHGIGIPEADRAWLFNAFHRGSNVGQRPGTGLGLVIVKRCVELHRGRIALESAPGQGTTVTVGLPLFPKS